MGDRLGPPRAVGIKYHFRHIRSRILGGMAQTIISSPPPVDIQSTWYSQWKSNYLRRRRKNQRMTQVKMFIHPLVLSSPTLMMHGHMNLKFPITYVSFTFLSLTHSINYSTFYWTTPFVELLQKYLWSLKSTWVRVRAWNSIWQLCSHVSFQLSCVESLLSTAKCVVALNW